MNNNDRLRNKNYLILDRRDVQDVEELGQVFLAFEFN